MKILELLLALKRPQKKFISFIIDSCSTVLAFFCALYLYNSAVINETETTLINTIIVITILSTVICNNLLGVYHLVLRFTVTKDIVRITIASTLSTTWLGFYFHAFHQV